MTHTINGKLQNRRKISLAFVPVHTGAVEDPHKEFRDRSWEMAQQVRVSTATAEDLSSIPSSYYQ